MRWLRQEDNWKVSNSAALHVSLNVKVKVTLDHATNAQKGE